MQRWHGVASIRHSHEERVGNWGGSCGGGTLMAGEKWHFAKNTKCDPRENGKEGSTQTGGGSTLTHQPTLEFRGPMSVLMATIRNQAPIYPCLSAQNSHENQMAIKKKIKTAARRHSGRGRRADRVAAAHAAQHFIVAGLEREVEHLAQRGEGGHRVHHPLRHIPRVGRHEPGGHIAERIMLGRKGCLFFRACGFLQLRLCGH